MFNTFLSYRRKAERTILFLVLFWATVFLSILAYKWITPIESLVKTETITVTEVTTEFVYEYENIVVQYDLGHLANGDNVKFNGLDLCVSSISTSNLKRYKASGIPPITIHFRPVGDCV